MALDNLENKEISLKPLSKGLGFYDSPLFSDSFSNSFSNSKGRKNIPGPKWPTPLMLEKLDLEDLNAYEQLLISLEKPYLGEKADVLLAKNQMTKNQKNHNAKTFSSSVAGSFVSTRAPAVTHKQNQQASSSPPPPFVNSSSSKNSSPVNQVASSPSINLNPIELKKKEKALPKTGNFFTFLKAYLTDAVFVSLLFFPPLIFFAFLTEPDPLTALTTLWPKILVVLFLFAQVYCFLCRLFCFETFGEAVARIRLFSFQKEVHPFRLFWRFLLSCLTGVILIPFLSLIFRKDFMARLTGLYFQHLSFQHLSKK